MGPTWAQEHVHTVPTATGRLDTVTGSMSPSRVTCLRVLGWSRAASVTAVTPSCRAQEFWYMPLTAHGWLRQEDCQKFSQLSYSEIRRSQK